MSCVSLAAAQNRLLFCVHNWKHSPTYRRAFEAVSAGRLGELRYCSLSRLRTQQAGGAPWRVDPVIGGGGILIDHGWHVFYLMQWLMGGRAPFSVAARLRRLSSGRRRGSRGSDGRPSPAAPWVTFILSWRAPARRTSAMLYGSEGMIEIEESTVRCVEPIGNQRSPAGGRGAGQLLPSSLVRRVSRRSSKVRLRKGHKVRSRSKTCAKPPSRWRYSTPPRRQTPPARIPIALAAITD